MASVLRFLFLPFIFNSMDVPHEAEGAECHADMHPLWECPQWHACKAFVAGKVELAGMYDPHNPNEMIHDSYV